VRRVAQQGSPHLRRARPALNTRAGSSGTDSSWMRAIGNPRAATCVRGSRDRRGRGTGCWP
jgi:hypothetical protein